MALLNNTKRPSNVRALEKTELLVLSADDFHELRQMIPQFDEAVKKLSNRKTRRKYCHFLNKIASKEKTGPIKL